MFFKINIYIFKKKITKEKEQSLIIKYVYPQNSHNQTKI